MHSILYNSLHVGADEQLSSTNSYILTTENIMSIHLEIYGGRVCTPYVKCFTTLKKL